MPTQTDLHKCQTPLRPGSPKYPRTSKRAGILLGVVWYEKFIGGFGGETLSAVPGHVLDHEEGAVDDEDVVEGAVADDCFVEAFDYAGENG